jgi:hypothetical protein
MDLAGLLDALDPDAPLAQRNLWLMDLLRWVRGDASDPQACVARVRLLLDAAQARPEWRSRWQRWWGLFIQTVDLTPLLADFGFAPRTAFLTAYQDAPYAARYRSLVERVRQAELPVSGRSELAEAVARNLFKLMAYKDEYEVARLHTDAAFAQNAFERHEAAPGGAVMASAERFARFDPNFAEAVLLVRQRMRARDHEATRAHGRQTFERHRHPIGGFHFVADHMQLGRRRADDGAGAVGVLRGGDVHFEPEFAWAFLEPAHRIGWRGIVAVEFVGGGADLGHRAEGGEQKHGADSRRRRQKGTPWWASTT